VSTKVRFHFWRHMILYPTSIIDAFYCFIQLVSLFDMSNSSLTLKDTPERPSAANSDAVSGCESESGCDSKSPLRKSEPKQSDSDHTGPGSFASPLRQNNLKLPSRYYGYTYTNNIPSSPCPTTSFPYFISTSMGYNQAYCINSPIPEHGENNFSEVVSFGGSPARTVSVTNTVSISADQKEPQDLPKTATSPLSNTVPVTFIQGPPPTYGQVHSSSTKSIWNGRLVRMTLYIC